MGAPVLHWEIAGKDGEALKAFYAELFGWEYEDVEPNNYGYVKEHVEGAASGGVGTSSSGTPSVTFYVATDDVTKSLEHAESLGAKTVMPATEIQDGLQIGLFTDPEGNMIGLAQPAG